MLSEQITLSQGRTTIVDKPVHEILMSYGWSWHLHAGRYAASSLIYYKHDGNRASVAIFLHRWVLESFYNIRLGGLQVDHVNRNTLDNRLENLRVATPSQNSWNTIAFKNNTSGYKGVFYDKAACKWRASIGAHNKRFYLGSYDTPEEAFSAYMLAAERLHQNFCNY